MLAILREYASLFIYPVIALFLSTALTRVCIRLLPKLGYIDKPGGRHIHDRLVPRGGGIAVILSFFIALGLFALEGHTPGTGQLFWKLFIPALLLGTLGMIDDRFDLKSYLKLAIQLAVVLIVWFNNEHTYTIFGWQIPWFLSLILTAGWIIIIINAFNLIDGLDGLASGLAIVSSCCMVIWFLIISGHKAETVTMMILAASCLGFLRYNFHPAKIFLGDTGSTFLGLIFAIIGLSTVTRTVTTTSLLLPILAIGVPFFDVVLAVWRRSIRKLLDPDADGIITGDKDHLHHRLLRKNQDQTKTAWSMYLLACLFSCIALFFIIFRNSVPAIAYIILVLAALIAIRRLAVIELLDSVQVIKAGLLKPRRGILVNIAHPLFDCLAISLSCFITSYLILGGIRSFNLLICAFAPTALALFIGRVYRVYWLRAGLSNYYYLAIAIISGSFMANLLVYFVFVHPDIPGSHLLNTRNCIAAASLFTLLNLFFIISERFLLHYAEAFWVSKLYFQNQQPGQLQKVLVYGGGLKCRIFVNYLYCTKNKKEQNEVIIGIVDDDSALYGLRIHGFKVLGQVADLEKIYETHRFDKIILTATPKTPDIRELLVRFCDEKGIAVTQFQIGETHFNAAPPLMTTQP